MKEGANVLEESAPFFETWRECRSDPLVADGAVPELAVGGDETAGEVLD